MEKVYQTILSFQRNHPITQSIIVFACNYFPKLTAIIYVVLIAHLFFINSPFLLGSILKPCLVFVCTGIFRKVFSRKRPYESLNINPIIKHKKGESFPSRHMASAMIISLTIYTVYPSLSIPLFFITGCIGISRFLVGIHYPSDILAGMLFSYLIYCI